MSLLGKCCYIVLLGLMCLVGEAHAEIIHFVNGDRLSGTIVSVKEGSLILDTEFAKKIKIPQKKIRNITSEKSLQVRFTSGEIYDGVVTADTDGAMLLQSPTCDLPVILKWEKVAAISPSLPQKPTWSGNIILGANLKSGNSDKFAFSVGMNVTRKSTKHRLSMGFLYNYAEEEGELSNRNAYGKLKYDYFLTSKLYSYLSSEFLNDTFKDLNLRTVIGPGVGYQLWDDEVKALAIEAGIAYYNEDLKVGPDDSWVTSRLAGTFRYKFADTVTFQEQLVLYPSLEKFGEFTLRNEAAVSTPLAFGWDLRLANIVEHDSDPESGIRKTDCDFVLGLLYGF